MKKSLIIASAISMMFAAPAAMAHKPGDVIVRAGAALVAPNDKSSELKVDGVGIGGKVAVGDNVQLGITAAYKLTDRLGVEVLAATPFTHRIDVKGLGALDGKLASTKHLPPTVTLQYYLLPSHSKWQPYVGAGVNYTMFLSNKLTSERKEQGFSKLKLSNSAGLALQVGSDYMINDRLLINASLWHIDIKTKARANLGDSKVTTKVNISPWVAMVGIGYRF